MKRGFLNSELERKKGSKKEEGSSCRPKAKATCTTNATSTNKTDASSSSSPAIKSSALQSNGNSGDSNGWMKRGFLQNDSIPENAKKREPIKDKNVSSTNINTSANANEPFRTRSNSASAGTWKKGFICSGNKKKGRQKSNDDRQKVIVEPQITMPKKSSSALLSLEDNSNHGGNALGQQPNRDSSVWDIVQNDQDITSSIKSNTTMATKADGAKKVQSSSNALLLPIESNKKESEDEAPFLQERYTRSKRSSIQIENDDNSQLENETKHHTGVEDRNVPDLRTPDLSRQPQTTLASNIVNTLPEDLSNLIAILKRATKKKTNSQKQIVDDDALTAFLEKYARTSSDSQLRTSTSGNIYPDMADVRVQSNIHFIWDSILENIATHATDKKLALSGTEDKTCINLPPLLRIGCSLLAFRSKEATHIIFDFCHDSRTAGGLDEDQSKRRRIQFLGALVVIRCRAVELYSALAETIQTDRAALEDDPTFRASIEFVQYILEYGISLFLRRKCDSVDGARKRSLIAVNAMDTSFLILEFSSFLCQVSISQQGSDGIRSKIESLQLCIWNRALLIREQVLIEKEWKEQKSRSAQDTHISSIYNESCAIAALDDWVTVLSNLQGRYDKQRLVDMVNEHDARLDAADILTRELAGLRLERNGRAPVCYGGIAHTLCKHSSIRTNDSISALLPILEAARQYTFLDREENVLASDDIVNESASVIMRQACTLLGQKKSLLNKNDKNSRAGSAKAMEICLMLLRSKSKRCMDLVSAALSVLLSSEADLLGDIRTVGDIQDDKASQDDNIPPSFIMLMNELASSGDEKDEHDPSLQVLCSLFTRLLLQNLKVLLPYFISRAKFNSSEVRVLVEILSKRDKCQDLTDGICLSIEQRLFGLLETNRHLQLILHTHDDVFCLLPLATIVDDLWDILLRNDASDLVSSAVSKLLTDTIVQRAALESNAIITRIVICLTRINNDTDSRVIGSQRLSKGLKFCGKWRKALLTNKACGDEAYAYFLLACGRAMFGDPSNGIILQLFGSLLDGKIIVSNDLGNVSHRRIARATACLVDMCMLEMERQIAKENEDTTAASNMFLRLSPLLLLRKLSHRHFELAYVERNRDSLHHLASMLARNLGLSPNDSYTYKLSKEEKRLSADIAAICIPFSSSSSASDSEDNTSGFQMFCDHYLSTSLSFFERNVYADVEWNTLKVSLFIGCRAVQVSPDSIDKRDFASLTSFVMYVLHNINEGDQADDIANNIVELQTGCIEFLSTCICAIHMFPSSAYNTSKPHLIQELPRDREGIKAADADSHCDSNLEYLYNLRQDIFRMINGHNPNSFLCFEHMTITKVPAQICLLNALSISAQRCSPDYLPELSQAIVPNLLRWLLDDKVGDTVRHPLCVASAMQCLFNCFQRSKSFVSLKTHHASVQDSVKALFQVSVRTVGDRFDQFTTYDRSAVKMASLKLLVVIVSLNESAEGIGTVGGLIPPSDLVRAFSILNGVANMDEHEDVRRLAAHLFSFMQLRDNS